MTDFSNEQLAEIMRRIERMAVEPGAVEVSWRMRLVRPVYRMLGWQPKLSTARVAALLAALGNEDGLERCRFALGEAMVEIDENVSVAERACMVNGRAPTAQLAWLGRLCRVLAQASRTLVGEQAKSVAAAFDPVTIAAPLAVAVGKVSQSEPTVDHGQARLVELQLAAIDHIIEAARAESSFLERRRRLLEAARRLLLDADAALSLDVEGVRLRRRYLTEQIVHVDRLQGTGLSPRVGLLHQARAAASRGQRGQLYAALVAIEGFATAAGDMQTARLCERALAGLTADADTTSDAAQRKSLASSACEVMGAEIVDAVKRAYARNRKQLKKGLGDPELLKLALDYLAPGAEDAALSALLSVDGCFDVGAPLAPVRVEESRTVARVVSHPTQDLMLVRARGPEDLPAAVIEDPRRLLLDLAQGRLLARKYVRYEEVKSVRTEMMGEVRVYLLDGSTSMLEDLPGGARARMRDAILSAELATLLRRFRNPQRFTRVILFYRYFTRRMWPLHRVATAEEAIAAMGEVLGHQRSGGTDIEKALATCFDMIRDARADDPELARGQIVLVTDGQAEVRDEVVREARERLGAMPVAVSVIALGEENDALRRLVARQRARGERAFYHFIDDTTLGDLCDGRVGTGRALHLDDAALSASELLSAVDLLLQDAATLEQDRHRVVLHPTDHLPEALAELGLESRHMTDGQRALAEASERDRRALSQRYARWFPSPDAPAPDATEDPDADAVVVLLATVAEVVGELGGDDLARKADAIDVLERLLPDARLSPVRFDMLVRRPNEAICQALAAVHEATGSVSRAFGH